MTRPRPRRATPRRSAARRATHSSTGPSSSLALAIRDPHHLLPGPAGTALAALPPVVAHAGLQAEGLSRFKPTSAQRRALERAFPDEEISILPSGEIYVEHAFLRKRLNEVFGPVQYSLEPRSELKVAEHGTRAQLMQQYVMLVDGLVASPPVWGDAIYYTNNPQQSYAKADSAVRSFAFRRACKEMGVGLQCWSRLFGYRFKLRYGVLVSVRQRDRSIKPQWRRHDYPPYPGEFGLEKHSPNRGLYKGVPSPTEQTAAAWEIGAGEVEAPDGVGASAVSTSAAGEEERDTRPITDPQRKRIFALLSHCGRDERLFRAWLAVTYRLDSTKDLQRWQYDDLCAAIESGDCVPPGARVPGQEG